MNKGQKEQKAASGLAFLRGLNVDREGEGGLQLLPGGGVDFQRSDLAAIHHHMNNHMHKHHSRTVAPEADETLFHPSECSAPQAALPWFVGIASFNFILSVLCCNCPTISVIQRLLL